MSENHTQLVETILSQNDKNAEENDDLEDLNDVEDDGEDSKVEEDSKDEEESKDDDDEDNDDEASSASTGGRGKKHNQRHFFSGHIRKLLAIINPDLIINTLVKTQLSDLAIILTELFVRKLASVVHGNDRKIVGETDMDAAIQLVLYHSPLAMECVANSHAAIDLLQKAEESGIHNGFTRQTKAELVIPPSMVEKCIRKGDFNIHPSIPVRMASVLQTLLIHLLRQAVAVRGDNSKQRLNMAHVNSGVLRDPVLQRLFVDNRIQFVTVSSEDEYVFPRKVFEQKFKQVLSAKYPDLRFQKNCFNDLHGYFELWVTRLFRATNEMNTCGGKKTRMQPADLEFMHNLLENRKSFLKDDES